MAKKAARSRTFIQASRNVSPEEKAAFHQVSGAGRSRVLRPFLGITPADELAIVDRFALGLDRVLKNDSVTPR